MGGGETPMMTGETDYKREAILSLAVRSENGVSEVVRAVIDTGFTDALMIEESLANRLGLIQVRTRSYQLGDGSTVQLNRYRVTLEWNGKPRTVVATASDGGGALVGMRLLYGFSLTIDVVDGGAVRLLRMD